MKKHLLVAALLAMVSIVANGALRDIPAHFLPTQADYDASLAFPIIEEEDYPNWGFGNYFVRSEGEYLDVFRCYETYNAAASDWLVLPQLASAGKEKLTIKFKAATTAKVSYRVVWGTEPVAEALTNVIYDNPEFCPWTAATEVVEKEFAIPANQDIYVAFHVYTERGASKLDIWDITISGDGGAEPPVPVLPVPAEPTVDIAVDGCHVVATIIFPEKDVDGNDLTAETLAAVLKIDDSETLQWTLNAAPGSELSQEFDVEDGRHTAVCTVSYTSGETTVTSLPATKTFSASSYKFVDPETYSTLPADQFTIQIQSANLDGVTFTMNPVDPLQLYTYILVDEKYVTIDNLDDLDFAEQIVQVSNQMLDYCGFDGSMEAEFFYLGDKTVTAHGNMPVGVRAFLAVMGVDYDEATNKVSCATKVVTSEVFEFEDGYAEPETPWVEFGELEYTKNYPGKKVIRAHVIPNATVDNMFGTGFAPDYRDTHTDKEIIDYLTATENMTETVLFRNDFDAYAEPGEKVLLAITAIDKTGKKNNKLNWIIVQAPEAIGGEVKVLATSGIGAVDVDASTSASGFFTVGGISVGNDIDRLAPGIYLKLNAGKVSKIIVR